MSPSLTFISADYLEEYSLRCESSVAAILPRLAEKSDFTPEEFEYCLIASSLYSSKIEGNTLDANSFFRNRGKKTAMFRKEVQDIEYLTTAYQFASENPLTLANFLKVHAVLSKNLLPATQRGKFRKEPIGVWDSVTLWPIYVAVEPEFVKVETGKLFKDIERLMAQELTLEEVFYYSSMIHLWIAMIHPFMDGNGRSARLVEKWFLASKLGKIAWSILSEWYYWENRADYYEHISLGFNYYALRWERCHPFLQMLQNASKDSLKN